MTSYLLNIVPTIIAIALFFIFLPILYSTGKEFCFDIKEEMKDFYGAIWRRFFPESKEKRKKREKERDEYTKSWIDATCRSGNVTLENKKN